MIVSQASYDQKMEDLDLLNKEKIPANSQAIEAARELGDLRENAEYREMAKDEQKVLLVRQSELQTDLMRGINQPILWMHRQTSWVLVRLLI